MVSLLSGKNTTGIEKKVVGETVRRKGDEVSNLGYLMTSLVFYTVHLM